jgi:hypothetical protein
MHMMTLLRLLLVLGIAPYLLNQVRRPGKWIELPFAWLTKLSHSRLTDWS